MTGQVRIGTSGFSYPHWVGVLYPEGAPTRLWLEVYAKAFDTVEINASFYRLPKISTFEGWRARSPEGFLFALKGSRYITHIQRLLGSQAAATEFLKRAACIAEKLGPILFQLPPGMKADRGRLEAFLEILPRERRFTFEFRHPSWFEEGIYRILRRRNAALCLHDIDGFSCPSVLSAGWTYLRFHGPTGRYYGRYSERDMAAWAERIARWRNEGVDVFAYFNNDAQGHAVLDAQALRERVQSI